jgi:hypothetical protein
MLLILIMVQAGLYDSSCNISQVKRVVNKSRGVSLAEI